MPTDDPDSTASLLADIDQEGRRWRGPHPSTEKLAAYRASRLPAAEEAPVQQHLVLCARCQQRLLDYAAFDDDATAQAESDGAALGAAPAGAWESLSARLAADRAAAPGAGAPAAVAAPPSVTLRPRAGRAPEYTVAQYRGAVVALAAALVLCCVAFPVWFANRPQKERAQGQAVSGPPGVETTRGSNQVIDVRLNDGVLLPVPRDRPFAVYRVDVYGQGDVLALTAKVPLPEVTLNGAAPNAPSTGQPAPAQMLMISLYRVAAGNYRAIVYGQDGKGAGEVVAEFGLRIR
jgi:hypothetical protein